MATNIYLPALKMSMQVYYNPSSGPFRPLIQANQLDASHHKSLSQISFSPLQTSPPLPFTLGTLSTSSTNIYHIEMSTPVRGYITGKKVVLSNRPNGTIRRNFSNNSSPTNALDVSRSIALLRKTSNINLAVKKEEVQDNREDPMDMDIGMEEAEYDDPKRCDGDIIMKDAF
jgi:hypothetical protein